MNRLFLISILFNINIYGIDYFDCAEGDYQRFMSEEGLREYAPQDHLENIYPSITESKIKYKCPKCPYSTENKKVFNNHIRAHENKREFKCDYEGCNAAFNQPSGLHAHKKKHLMIYECKICYKSFSDAADLEGHMNDHEGLTPYGCTQNGCNAAFKSKKLLSQHLRKKHNIKKRSYRAISKDPNLKDLYEYEPKAKRFRLT